MSLKKNRILFTVIVMLLLIASMAMTMYIKQNKVNKENGLANNQNDSGELYVADENIYNGIYKAAIDFSNSVVWGEREPPCIADNLNYFHHLLKPL